MANLDGFDFIPAKREIRLHSGKPLTWSHNSDCCGYWGWAGLKAGYFVDVAVHLRFNEDYTYADMPMTCCMCCPLFNGMKWTMKELDENTWFRTTYLCCSPLPWKHGSYTLKRIIDGDGNRLPAFKEMMEQLRDRVPVQGVTVKTMRQIVNIRPGTKMPTSATKAAVAPPTQVMTPDHGGRHHGSHTHEKGHSSSPPPFMQARE